RRGRMKYSSDDIAQEGTHDTNDDVQNNALLRIGPHEQAGKPANNAADNQCDDKAHSLSSHLQAPICAGNSPTALSHSASFDRHRINDWERKKVPGRVEGRGGREEGEQNTKGQIVP